MWGIQGIGGEILLNDSSSEREIRSDNNCLMKMQQGVNRHRLIRAASTGSQSELGLGGVGGVEHIDTVPTHHLSCP